MAVSMIPMRYPRRLLLAGVLLLAACGENAWRDLPTGGTGGSGGTGGGGSTGGAAARDTVAPAEPKILVPQTGAVAAVGDSLRVTVAVSDETALARVTVEAFTLAGTERRARFDTVSVAYAAADTVRSDTVSVLLPPRLREAAERVLVVARVLDRAGNTRADTLEISLAEIRGARVTLADQVDRIADMVSDGRRLFLSNFTRNRVEVIDVASGARSSFAVGSQPWGMALSRARDTLFVANSGGTNISVVPLAAGTLSEDPSRRILTPNSSLFRVTYARTQITTVSGTDTTRSSVLAPGSVEELDYSDRPQFIAQTAGGDLLYSTRPTGAATQGTIRWRQPNGLVEFFVDYARRDQASSLVVLNARGAGLVEADPANRLSLVDAEGRRYLGFVDQVEQQLADNGSQTRFEYFVNLGDVALRDTTFVAVSGDHSTVAFGEGAAAPGRIILVREAERGFISQIGETDDLVGNASERVVGLALNRDGSLGAARGENAYFFTPELRLQGVGVAGPPAGGIGLHPEHAGYPARTDGVAFVSGVDENNSPFLDVIDTFTFFRRRRIFLRDAITGPLLTVPAPAGSSAALRLYALTAAGLLQLDLVAADLAR